MKLIKIPEDMDDVADLSIFNEAIVEINKFNRNLTKFGNKILNGQFLKSKQQWLKLLSDVDIDKLNVDSLSDGLYLFDYKNKRLVPFDVKNYGFAWSMGASTGKEHTVSFSDCGNVLIINQTWETQEARFSHIPWIKQEKTFYVDYINRTVLEELPKRKKKCENEDLKTGRSGGA